MIRFAQVAIVLGAMLGAAPALATPGSGFVPSPIVNGHFGQVDQKVDKVGSWDLVLRTKDDTDIGADRLTVQPQGYSGWHSHPAPVMVTVTHGTVEWLDAATCSPRTYTVGQSYIEPAGRAHNVRNPAAAGGQVAEFIAVVIKPAGFVGPAFRLDQPLPASCQ